MKNILALLSFCIVFTLTNAQTPPNAFNYSAVARNTSGQPIANTTIGIQTTIIKTSPAGASQYSENHSVSTDEFGLFNLTIGGGAVQSGSINNIDWSTDSYYLQVGMDVTGGSNYLTMGTTQLLSVPYALYAKSAGTLNNNNLIYNFDYPDGLNGEPIIIQFNQPFTVPPGKNLYGFQGTTYLVSINSIQVYEPKIVPENSTIIVTNDSPLGQEIMVGFLANKIVDAIIWDTNTSNTFTVPQGKTLYLASNGAFLDGAYFLLNGSQFSNSYGGFGWSMFPSGSVITFQSNSGTGPIINGYLR